MELPEYGELSVLHVLCRGEWGMQKNITLSTVPDFPHAAPAQERMPPVKLQPSEALRQQARSDYTFHDTFYSLLQVGAP